MVGWMGLPMDADGWIMDGWINQWMHQCINGWINQSTDTWINGWMNQLMDKWMDDRNKYLRNGV